MFFLVGESLSGLKTIIVTISVHVSAASAVYGIKL